MSDNLTQQCAETLISMYTDFLMGGIDEDTFKSNLKLFATRINEDSPPHPTHPGAPAGPGRDRGVRA